MNQSQLSLRPLIIFSIHNYQGNVFTPVCHSVHRGSAIPPHHPGRHPWADTHPGQTPLCADTPWADTHPPRQTPPGQTPPCTVHAGKRSTSGWYSSYWNAILLTLMLLNITENWSFISEQVSALDWVVGESHVDGPQGIDLEMCSVTMLPGNDLFRQIWHQCNTKVNFITFSYQSWSDLLYENYYTLQSQIICKVAAPCRLKTVHL